MIKSSETDTVWLDLDDTLIDFTTNSRRALNRLYRAEELGRYFADAEKWTATYEHHNHRLWTRYAAAEISCATLRADRFRLPFLEGGMPEGEAARLAEICDTEYLDFLAEETALIPGAISLLKRIRKAGMAVGLVSNGFADVQHRKIANCGLSPYIDFTVLSDDIGITKPDVRLFRHAMDVAGSHVPERNLMIGDNRSTDIAGALAAGWRAIMFCRSGVKSGDSLPYPEITDLDSVTIS